MPLIHVPDVLWDRLGPEATKALVELINQSEARITGDVIQLAEERFARRLAETIAALETRLTERIAAVETRLTRRIAAVETRVIRWTFALWLTVLGILFAFFKP